jgi:SAM-dependent methyltransferase
MNALYNISARIVRRTLEIPYRGFPKGQTSREPFDDILGVKTSGVVWLTNPGSENALHGVRYEPCSVAKCNWLIENAGIDPKQFAFIDVGCGKGRPLVIASQHNFAELIGVDYSQKLCDIARTNMRKVGASAKIICQDASLFPFPERDIFVFLYHPFDSVILDKVLANLHSVKARADKRIVVAYQGKGREDVAKHDWLKRFAADGDTIVYRNF